MKILIIAILWIVSLMFSFYLGTNIGVKEYLLVNSQYKAAFTASQLRMIEAGRIDEHKEILEIELNGHIARHGDYLDSKMKWLWPQLKAETPRAINSAVEYRISHPYQDPDLADPKNRLRDIEVDNPFLSEVIEGQKHNRKQIERVIEKYTFSGG